MADIATVCELVIPIKSSVEKFAAALVLRIVSIKYDKRLWREYRTSTFKFIILSSYLVREQ